MEKRLFTCHPDAVVLMDSSVSKGHGVLNDWKRPPVEKGGSLDFCVPKGLVWVDDCEDYDPVRDNPKNFPGTGPHRCHVGIQGIGAGESAERCNLIGDII